MKTEFTRRKLISGAGAATLGSVLARSTTAQEASEIASLRRIFEQAPASARPMTRWWWFGGAISPEEITREMTFMRDAGLGGVEIQPVYPVAVDNPALGIRNTPYFTDAWFDLLRHAAREAARLDLQFDLTLGSGWPYGGPFVPIQLSARRLQMFQQTVEGPRRVTFAPLSGEVMEGDNVLLIVATPLLASGALDLVNSRIVGHGEMALYNGWQVPAGKWRVTLAVDSATRMQVKRPTIGMEGYVLDHFNREALRVFLDAAGDRVLPELASVGPRPIHSIFCDSLEVYGADWTGALLEEFKRRRQYDLAPYLPALWEDAGPLTPHVRYDYHLTLSELILENFFQPLAAWSKTRGVSARVQAHGAMGDVMRAYSYAPIPEGEDNPGHDRYSVNLQHRRLASSAAHIYGKPLISAETYTAMRSPLYLVTLEMMKAVTDGMFLDGITQIVNHGYASSPPTAGLPGWSFYAASEINHNNTWWRHYKHLARYIRQVCALLRQGTQVNPVAVYLPLADVYAKYGCGSLNLDEALQQHLGLELFNSIRRAGYDFDTLNDHALTEVATVSGSRLRAGTAEYRAVIVPPCELIPPESMARLLDFASSGGTLIFAGRIPGTPPGLLGQEPRTARLEELIRDLSSKPNVHRSRNAGEAIEHLRAALTPDFAIVSAGANSEPELQSARENVGFVHRTHESTDLYFVSNISSLTRDLRVRLGCGHKRPERWNPETAETGLPLAFQYVGGGNAKCVEIGLHLEPFESAFVVCYLPADRPAITRTDLPSLLAIERTPDGVRVTGRAGENREYTVTRFDGQTFSRNVSDIPDVVPIGGPWKLRLGNAAAVELDRLHSWNELPEGKVYSGWGTYETMFDLAHPGEDIAWTLDLGSVHETAEAELNGISLGAAWKGARKLSCAKALKAGRNLLRIDVANLWIHHVINSPPWDRKDVAAIYGARWGEPDLPLPRTLPPSGLLGPVRLLAAKHLVFRLQNRIRSLRL